MNVDFSEVQSHVLLGFKDEHQALVFFRITDPSKFRAKLSWFEGMLTWTAELLPADEPRSFKVALALAFRGVAKLLPPGALSWLERPLPGQPVRYGAGGKSAFAEDCYARANRILLDSYDELAKWVVGAPANAPDGLLIVADPTADGVRKLVEDVTRKLAACTQWIHVDIGDRRSGREHFGFRDGVSHQSVDVSDPNRPTTQLRVAGSPLQHHPGESLLLSQTAAPMPAWLEGSSYLVFRRLRQDVPGFHRAVAAVAATSGQTVGSVATRVLGRSAEGVSPLAPPNSPLSDKFDYSSDLGGAVCPFNAHVRRANPRSTDVSLARPVFRRSVPYGQPSASTFDAPQAEADTIERGLLFLCYQASIEKQFEYVTRAWCNNHDSSLGPIDALVGRKAGTTGVREIELGLPAPVQLASYVSADGGGYFLTPSRTALRKILETVASP